MDVNLDKHLTKIYAIIKEFPLVLTYYFYFNKNDF